MTGLSVVMTTTMPAGDADHITTEVIAYGRRTEAARGVRFRAERAGDCWTVIEPDGSRIGPLTRDTALGYMQRQATAWAAEVMGWER